MFRPILLPVTIALLFFSSSVNAFIIQQTHSDSWNYATRAIVAGGASGGFLFSGNAESHLGRSPTVSIQRFNPLLGTLQAVDVFLQFRAKFSITADCSGIGYCESEGSGNGTHTILLDDLGADLGVSFIDYTNPAAPPTSNVTYGAGATTQCDGVFPCSASNGGADFQELLFSFLDDDVAGFIDDLDDPADDVFVFYREGKPEYTGFRAFHKGYPSDENVEQFGDDSNDLGLLLAAIDLYAFQNQHGLFYSDIHVKYWSSFDVAVTYTYETPSTGSPVAVPAPNSLLLLLSGLIPLARKAGKRKHGLQRHGQ
ncbi:MAG: hypothetical protein RRB22_10425 [Gammaproteobacteria bacterium]|nr:hypothetical protein [Gammaproteobacteria bacterium]